jgi:hypothetical protein
VEDPQGIDGELIDRLLAAVNSPHDRDWVDLGWYLVFTVGGDELHAIVPDTGDEPAPGTVGEEIRKTHEVVTRDVYFRRMRMRLMRLVDSGVREDFLVRSVREELTAHRQEFAQTEGADTRREELRNKLEQPTPERIAGFRAALARKDPGAELLTDEQISDRLREMAARVPPISREHAQDAWERASRWNDQAAAVSDHVIALWRDRYDTRMLRRM